MQTADHKLLGKYILQKEGEGLSFSEKMAFLAGNVEPDRNPFTYLHGILHGQKFHGHNYENILPVMQKTYAGLKNQKYTGIRKYYHLGKLLHYTADSFTFPHNRTFKKSLKEHRRYESELHRRFLLVLQDEMSRDRIIHRMNRFEDLKAVHREYMRNAGSYIQDCEYIFRASAMVARSVLNEMSLPLQLARSGLAE